MYEQWEAEKGMNAVLVTKHSFGIQRSLFSNRLLMCIVDEPSSRQTNVR